MSSIIGGSNPAVTFPDGTTQSTAFTTGAVTQSTIATGVAGTGPAFSAYGTQTLSTTTIIKCVLNAKIFDTNSNFDALTNYRFTPTIAGYYQVNINHQYGAAGGAGGVCIGYIYKNGAQYTVPLYEFLDTNLTSTAASGSLLVQMNRTTDYLEVYAFQSSGLNQTIVSYFNGSLVRAA
jgi:hypothetical protein